MLDHFDYQNCRVHDGVEKISDPFGGDRRENNAWNQATRLSFPETLVATAEVDS